MSEDRSAGPDSGGCSIAVRLSRLIGHRAARPIDEIDYSPGRIQRGFIRFRPPVRTVSRIARVEIAGTIGEIQLVLAGSKMHYQIAARRKCDCRQTARTRSIDS